MKHDLQQVAEKAIIWYEGLSEEAKVTVDIIGPFLLTLGWNIDQALILTYTIFHPPVNASNGPVH
jgi:hypothetical protein